jgi:predicted amidohydrolase YtcJ
LTDAQLEELEAIRTRFADDPVLKTGAIAGCRWRVESPPPRCSAVRNCHRSTGDARFTPEQLTGVVTMLDRRGWQVMTHAIGDAAVRMTLDAYEAAAQTNPNPERGRRHRIEHIETIDPEDVPRFGRIGVVASMQPMHATPSSEPGDVWSTNIGEARAMRGWLWAGIAKSKGPLAFGSDWPVMTLDPLSGLHVAVTRPTPRAA